MNKIIVYSFAVCCFVFGSMLFGGCQRKDIEKLINRSEERIKEEMRKVDEDERKVVAEMKAEMEKSDEIEKEEYLNRIKKGVREEIEDLMH
jgi:hypothetical protein